MPQAPLPHEGDPCRRAHPSHGRPRRSLCAALAALLLLACLPGAAQALVPERRRSFEDRAPNEYLLVPAVASLPGIGVFVGVIASGSNLLDTGIDVGATAAKSVDNTDISVQAVALQGVPTGIPAFTIDYQYAHIRLGNFEVYLPGRDSPNFTIPITARFDFQLVRPTLRFWERRIELSYGLGFFKGFDLDTSGNEQPLGQHSANGTLRLDFTDDVVDPRKGVRLYYRTTLDAPEHSILGDNEGTSQTFGGDDVKVHNYDVAIYVPLSEHLFLAWDNQFFEARGREDSSEVVQGGSPPLRGYPAGRWSDRYGVFSGVELRYLQPLGLHLDIILAHGVVQALEYAVFYEAGQVSPENNHLLYEDVHTSYGFGMRVLFEAIVLRFDLANSDEGVQTHLTVGHAF